MAIACLFLSMSCRLALLSLAILIVNRRTGYVTSAQMQQSTGYRVLDDAALSAFGGGLGRVPRRASELRSDF
jgi:hypothetical protein